MSELYIDKSNTILSSPKLKLTAPKAILFDWHATLVDTLDAMYHAVDDVLLMFDELGLLERLTQPGHSKTEEDAKLVAYVRDFQKLHPKLKADKKISRTDIFEVLFDQDSEAKMIAHREFNNCYRKHFGEIHPFEDGIDDMLRHFNSCGIKLGVLTNRDREFLQHEISIIDVTGWDGLFDILVCGDDVSNRKPAPDLILKGVSDLQLSLGLDIWHVGDSTTDMAASEKAGVTSIFFNGAGWDENWLHKIFPATEKHPFVPDAIVNNFAEFRELVDQCLPDSEILTMPK